MRAKIDSKPSIRFLGLRSFPLLKRRERGRLLSAGRAHFLQKLQRPANQKDDQQLADGLRALDNKTR